jgi:hypothetical protein
MGQKVNPIGIRLGITRDWVSKWYASSRNFPDYVYNDYVVRDFLKRKLYEASVSRIQIERAARKVNITIHTARPGIVIGKKGEDIEKVRLQVAKMMAINNLSFGQAFCTRRRNILFTKLIQHIAPHNTLNLCGTRQAQNHNRRQEMVEVIHKRGKAPRLVKVLQRLHAPNINI